MGKAQRKQRTRLAAIEINASLLNVCVWHDRGDGRADVQTLSLPWRHEATSLHSEQGAMELAAALKRAAGQLKLQGVETWLTLAGDYCVTRVVTGSEEHVRHELAELEARSELYISLGHGPKTLAGSIRQIDARQRHALLSVVNQKTLDTLTAAAAGAGLKLERIEPSLVSLCRLVGRIGADEKSPVLLMHVGQRGADLGISHRGVLLLDYRPAGADNPQELAATVSRHLARLERYCYRYARVAGGKLQKVYLSGDPQHVTAMQQALEAEGTISPFVLDRPQQVEAAWNWDGAAPSWSLAAPAGLLLLQYETDRQQSSPNLLERLRRAAKLPLAQVFRPLVLPLAAALALAALGWLGVWYQAARCRRIERLAAEVETAARDVRLQQSRIAQSRELIEQFERLAAALKNPSHADLAQHVGQCLPDDVWLESVALEEPGRLVLSGGSYSEDGVFEFAKHLAKVPGLANVAVDGTRPGQFAGGSGTHFDVHGDWAETSAKEGHNDDRG